jgi:hypothetical protein
MAAPAQALRSVGRSRLFRRLSPSWMPTAHDGTQRIIPRRARVASRRAAWPASVHSRSSRLRCRGRNYCPRELGEHESPSRSQGRVAAALSCPTITNCRFRGDEYTIWKIFPPKHRRGRRHSMRQSLWHAFKGGSMTWLPGEQLGRSWPLNVARPLRNRKDWLLPVRGIY